MKFKPKKLITGFLVTVLLIAVFHWITSQIQVRRDIIWTSRSDEYRFTCLGLYNAAFNRLREAVTGFKEPWAVVMDVDDTCLSSSKYRNFKKRWRTLFYRPRWSDWCRKGEDPAVPGAADFTQRIRELGGKVVLITGRSEDLRGPTEKNLRKEGFIYDALLMSGPGRSKSAWRTKVETGQAVRELKPVKIVMLIGDQRSDFPSEATALTRSDEWGKKFFLIPNPMNGDWMPY